MAKKKDLEKRIKELEEELELEKLRRKKAELEEELDEEDRPVFSSLMKAAEGVAGIIDYIVDPPYYDKRKRKTLDTVFPPIWR